MQISWFNWSLYPFCLLLCFRLAAFIILSTIGLFFSAFQHQTSMLAHCTVRVCLYYWVYCISVSKSLSYFLPFLSWHIVTKRYNPFYTRVPCRWLQMYCLVVINTYYGYMKMQTYPTKTLWSNFSWLMQQFDTLLTIMNSWFYVYVLTCSIHVHTYVIIYICTHVVGSWN